MVNASFYAVNVQVSAKTFASVTHAPDFDIALDSLPDVERRK
jgi:hypothetical protein